MDKRNAIIDEDVDVMGQGEMHLREEVLYSG